MPSLPLDDPKVPVRARLAALWTSVMFCYVYGDYFELYRPGKLQQMLGGEMALGPVTQGLLPLLPPHGLAPEPAEAGSSGVSAPSATGRTTMPSGLRRVMAVVAGALVATGLVMLGDAVAGRMWTPGTGEPPATVLLVLVLGWGVAAAAGAAVATLLSEGRTPRAGRIVTLAVLAGTVMNLMRVPHPSWVWVAALLLVPAGGLLLTRALARGEA